MPFARVEDAVREFAEGRMVIVVDDEDRENEGDFVMAAQKVTPDAINFMAMHGRGLICMPITTQRAHELDLPPMVVDNTAPHETAFTVSIGAVGKITTGISAADRAATILAAIDDETRPEDLSRPGHVFPLRAKPGGVLERAGHTEAAIDLARLAGLYPGGVLCEIMNADGTMARLPELQQAAERFGLKLLTVESLIAYRRRTERLVERIAETRLPTPSGEFKAIGYRSLVGDEYHIALVKGEPRGCQDVLVRVHSECLTGDVFHSLRCDCGAQLEAALHMIEEAGCGVLLYIIGHEGRGIGLANKLRAYELQDEGHDTVEANEALGLAPDLRDYGIGAQILADLGITTMRLITNNPTKIVGLEGHGLGVSEQVPLVIRPNPENIAYLKTKRDKLDHTLELPDMEEGR